MSQAEKLVLDSSVTMVWCLDDEATPSVSAVVPSIWRYEVANVTPVGDRRNRLDEARGRLFLAFLAELPIVNDSESADRAFTLTSGLARDSQLSIYDAACLELAIRRNLPLASLDRKLLAAASSLGVPILAIEPRLEVSTEDEGPPGSQEKVDSGDLSTLE